RRFIGKGIGAAVLIDTHYAGGRDPDVGDVLVVMIGKWKRVARECHVLENERQFGLQVQQPFLGKRNLGDWRDNALAESGSIEIGTPAAAKESFAVERRVCVLPPAVGA